MTDPSSRHWARVGFGVLINGPIIQVAKPGIHPSTSRQVRSSTHNMWEHPSSDKSWVPQKRRSPTSIFLNKGRRPQSHYCSLIPILLLCHKYPLLIWYLCFVFPIISFWNLSSDHGSAGKATIEQYIQRYKSCIEQFMWDCCYL